ncbi:MAG: hypothetical protein ACE145_04235 [Terriglobia bacterium]
MKVRLPKRVIYYGVDEPLPEQVPLRAGPLTLAYEAGGLRYIRLGQREILRRIYVAVRDRNWGTVPPRISNLRKETTRDSFRISYEVTHRQGEIDFFWKGNIAGKEDGSIIFTLDGIARSTFLKNRIGFCVLHPIRECAGRPCVMEQVNGKIVEGNFPHYISPHQPFLDMRSISHEVMPGLTAEIRFEGDDFEMEDQRNWADASYKTYCTPLRLPFPVEVQAGARILQSVTLKMKGTIPSPIADRGAERLTLEIHEGKGSALPQTGLGMASHSEPLSQQAQARLRALNLSHLRVDLKLGSPDMETSLRRAVTDASGIFVPLEAALFLSPGTEEDGLRQLRALVDQLSPVVVRWLIFHEAEKSTTAQWVALARKILGGYNPNIKFAAGTNAYFAELNRGQPPNDGIDLVTYSINPQVHAFDSATMVENLEAQTSTIESARQFVSGRRVVVSPVTLKPRFNPNATGPGPEPAPGELPSQVDARQMSLFGAGWTLGSIKYLAESGVHSLTYFETTGWRGVMETEQGSPVPEKFCSIPGAVFPVYHVLADICEFSAGEVVLSSSNAPLAVEGLTLRKDGRTRILLANFTGQEQHIQIHGADTGKVGSVKFLDETNAQFAMTSPESFRKQRGEALKKRDRKVEISLGPYAVARIDHGDLK